MKYIVHPVLLFFCICLSACQLLDKPADKNDFQLWLKKSANAANSNKLKNYLTKHGVANVFPSEQLLSSDVRWQLCMADQFSVPSEKDWPHIINTLRIIQNEVIPLVGKVDALSVYRSPKINRCILGASASFHLSFHAIDMQTRKQISREKLIEKLCLLYRKKGKSLNMGLGIYAGQRFHIDAAGYRTWGVNYKASSSPCR
jgi:uncharacterized protein YcbK (DUF882 family)